jgi:hypothetical protein
MIALAAFLAAASVFFACLHRAPPNAPPAGRPPDPRRLRPPQRRARLRSIR